MLEDFTYLGRQLQFIFVEVPLSESHHSGLTKLRNWSDSSDSHPIFVVPLLEAVVQKSEQAVLDELEKFDGSDDTLALLLFKNKIHDGSTFAWLGECTLDPS
jgi:hypothetical protein